MCLDLRSNGDGPEGRSQQMHTTEIHSELAELREVLLVSGAFSNRRERRQHARDVATFDAALGLLQTNAQPPDPPPPRLSLVPTDAPAAAAAASAVPATRMIVFVMESYGGLAREAIQLLNQLAAHLREYTPQEFFRHAYDRLSVAPRASNADISEMGMQHLTMRVRVHTRLCASIYSIR